MDKNISKKFFSIEKKINTVARLDLFDRISDLSTIRNPKQEEFLRDLDRLVKRYDTVPSLSKKVYNFTNIYQ